MNKIMNFVLSMSISIYMLNGREKNEFLCIRMACRRCCCQILRFKDEYLKLSILKSVLSELN